MNRKRRGRGGSLILLAFQLRDYEMAENLVRDGRVDVNNRGNKAIELHPVAIMVQKSILSSSLKKKLLVQNRLVT